MLGNTKFGLAAALLALGFHGMSMAGPIYDAAADFSFSNNPNGVWRYGYETTLGGALNTYTAKTTHLTGSTPDVQFWMFNAQNTTTPSVGFNPTAGDVTYASTTVRSGHVTAHPGPANELSVIRFVAPSTGSYQLTSSFNMRSFGGTHSTDVHVLLDNNTLSQLFNSTVNAFNESKSYNALLLLTAGDFIDFVVGANGSFLGDTTQLDARFEFSPNQVPEPGGLLLTALAIGLLSLNRRPACRSLPKR